MEQTVAADDVLAATAKTQKIVKEVAVDDVLLATQVVKEVAVDDVPLATAKHKRVVAHKAGKRKWPSTRIAERVEATSGPEVVQTPGASQDKSEGAGGHSGNEKNMLPVAQEAKLVEERTPVTGDVQDEDIGDMTIDDLLGNI